VNTHRSRTFRRLAVVLVGALLATGLAACGSDSDSKASPDTKAKTTSDAKPSSISIAYQLIPNGDLIVKHEGWLEKALPGVDISWKLFDSGGSVNEAILAPDGPDIGLAGSSPVSRGLSTGIEYQVPWIFDVIGDAEALVVKSDITSFDDLKGKTIATPIASTSHYSLLAALQEHGLSESDVKIIDAEPDAIYAAWAKGDIDGAYVWNPNLAKIVDGGGKILITSADLAKKGKTTYDLAVVTNSFASQYPSAVTTWLEQQNRAIELIKSDPDKAAADIASELNITPKEAKAQLDGLIFVNAGQQVGPDYLGGGLATNLYNAAVFNQKLGQIPSTEPKSTYRKAVVPTFAQTVADQK
jgi:taurine transport system substrate-binding protein